MLERLRGIHVGERAFDLSALPFGKMKQIVSLHLLASPVGHWLEQDNSVAPALTSWPQAFPSPSKTVLVTGLIGST